MNHPHPGKSTFLIELIYEDVAAAPPIELGRIRWKTGEPPTGTTLAAEHLLALRLEQHDQNIDETIRELINWSNGYVRTRLSTKGPERPPTLDIGAYP